MFKEQKITQSCPFYTPVVPVVKENEKGVCRMAFESPDSDLPPAENYEIDKQLAAKVDLKRFNTKIKAGSSEDFFSAVMRATETTEITETTETTQTTETKE